MIRLIEINAGRASLVAVTNDAASPLALASDCPVLIHAGIEATVSCKTYTCTTLALSRIGEVLCGGGSGRRLHVPRGGHEFSSLPS